MIASDEPGIRTILISIASDPVESIAGAVTTLAKLTLLDVATPFAISTTLSSVSALMLSSPLEKSCEWRRGRDSNPRYGCPYAAFRVRCDRPLCHLSRGRGTYSPGGAREVIIDARR